MKEIIIFCQAPADVQYALSIYDKNKDFAEISIFCVNVEGMYKFLSSLNLRLKQLVFIPYLKDFSIKNPIHILNEKKRLKGLYQKYFCNVEGNEIYFFSHFYDWVLFSILGRLNINNEIYLIDHLGYTSNKFSLANISFEVILVRLLYKYITGVFLNLYINNACLVIGLPFKKYNITKIPILKNLNTIWRKYQFNLPIEGLSALLFESGKGDSDIILNYKKSLLDLLKRFREENIRIFIKPHPRMGFSKFLENKGEMIPEYIPGEFLPINKFLGVFGITTAVIGKLARNNKNVFSLIDYFDFKNKSDKDYYKQYLLEQSGNKIIFVSNLDSMIDNITYSSESFQIIK